MCLIHEEAISAGAETCLIIAYHSILFPSIIAYTGTAVTNNEACMTTSSALRSRAACFTIVYRFTAKGTGPLVVQIVPFDACSTACSRTLRLSTVRNHTTFLYHTISYEGSTFSASQTRRLITSQAIRTVLALAGSASSLVNGDNSKCFIIDACPEVAKSAVITLGSIAGETLFTIVHNTILAEDIIRHKPSIQAVFLVHELSAEDDCDDAADDAQCANNSQSGSFHSSLLLCDAFLIGKLSDFQVLTCSLADIE